MPLRRSLMTLSSLPFLLVTVALVCGDFATFQDFGKHALCMQDWKKATKLILANLENNADNALSSTLNLNVTLQAAAHELETQFDALNTSVYELVDTLNAASSSSGSSGFQTPMSAFQTYITSLGSSSSWETDVPIKYTDEVLDENNDHDTETGLFTCPKLGLYWFHATLTGSGRNVVYFRVTRVDGQTENIAYMKYNYNQETSATAMAVLYPGDTVGIYPEDASSFSLAGGSANTFAGYLLADYDDPNYTPATTTAAPTTPSTAAPPATTLSPTTAAPVTTPNPTPTTAAPANPPTATTTQAAATTTSAAATTTPPAATTVAPTTATTAATTAAATTLAPTTTPNPTTAAPTTPGTTPP